MSPWSIRYIAFTWWSMFAPEGMIWKIGNTDRFEVWESKVSRVIYLSNLI